MIAPSELTGIVLAGGESSRFGSNKALAVVGGYSLLERSVALLKPLCSQVCISGNQAEYSRYVCPKVPDLIPGKGPLGGIYSALKQVTTPYVLFLTCDMPLLTEELLKRLLDKNPPADITLWKGVDGHLELFPSLYAQTVLPLVEQHIGSLHLSIRSLLPEAITNVLPIPEDEACAFLNVNHTTDLNHIKLYTT